MKRLVKWCVWTLLVAAAALFLAYRLINDRLPSSELPVYAQVYEILDEGGCISCHSADPETPFYAKMPVVGKVVMKDIDSGYRAYDIKPFMEKLKVDEPTDAVDLAKIEKVIQDERMPMPKYYLVHWGSAVKGAKRAIVLDWIRSERVKMYNDGLAGDRAAEPVRPIDQVLDVDQAKAALGSALFHDTPKGML